MGQDFSAEQKRFLEGFASGMQIARAANSVAAGSAVEPAPATPSGPDAAGLAAMAKTEAGGKKLTDQEKWKRAEHPFDAYERFKTQARAGAYPKPEDNFRWRFHGLFYSTDLNTQLRCKLKQS